MKSLKTLILLLSVLLWGTALMPAAEAEAQSIDWSEPLNLSRSETRSWHAAIVADKFGDMHVFWSEKFLDADAQGAGDTVMYTRWDGQTWTNAVDILAVPGDNVADYVAADVDQEGRLHIVWTGVDVFYYSSAFGWEAHSPHAWRQPIVVAGDSARSQLESDILVDSMGNVHIVYATRGISAGIYHIYSDSAGLVWSDPMRLSSWPDSQEIAFGNVKIVSDTTDRLHVVWQTFQSRGFGQAIYYTRSLDRGLSWESPQQLEQRSLDGFDTGWPYLAIQNESRLHLIYNSGPNSQGRFHRISNDSGATWGEPAHIITEMEGINGYVLPVVDGSGGLHLIINMRPRSTQTTGIYYSRWIDERWTPVVPVAIGESYTEAAHRADATIYRGNEIHIVFEGNGEIWHIRGAVPGVDPFPVATVPAAPSVREISHPEKDKNISVRPSSALTTLPISGSLPPGPVSPPKGVVTTWTAIVVGIAPVLALLSSVVVFRLRSRR